MSEAKNNGFLNVGILGFGAMGKAHTYAIKNLPFYCPSLPFDVKLGGVCTTSAEKSSMVAQTFGFEKAVTNEDDLIYDDSIDIIDICTPNTFHYSTIIKALRAGKNIYCEKPLCISFAEAEEAASLAREKGLICAVVFNNRFLAPILRAKQLIDEGRLGRILSFNAVYYHNSCTDLNKKAGWKQNRDICGGGVLFDLGSHIIDLIYHLCGEFREVVGISQIGHPTRMGMNGEVWQTNADEAFYMLAELECGAKGMLCASKLHTGTNDDIFLEIYGEKGAIRYSLMEPEWLHFYDSTRPDSPIGGERGFTKIECVGRFPAPGGVFPAPKAPVGWLMGHVNSYANFLDAVYNGIPCHPNFTDAAHIQGVMEAAYRSAEIRTPVKIKDITG